MRSRGSHALGCADQASSWPGHVPACAPIPVKSGNPEPATFTPACRSNKPSAAPNSQCGLGAKSRTGGAPQERISRLADASPSGVWSSGKFGRVSARASSWASMSLRSSSSDFYFLARDLQTVHEVCGRLLGALSGGPPHRWRRCAQPLVPLPGRGGRAGGGRARGWNR